MRQSQVSVWSEQLSPCRGGIAHSVRSCGDPNPTATVPPVGQGCLLSPKPHGAELQPVARGEET